MKKYACSTEGMKGILIIEAQFESAAKSIFTIKTGKPCTVCEELKDS